MGFTYLVAPPSACSVYIAYLMTDYIHYCVHVLGLSQSSTLLINSLQYRSALKPHINIIAIIIIIF